MTRRTIRRLCWGGCALTGLASLVVAAVALPLAMPLIAAAVGLGAVADAHAPIRKPAALQSETGEG